ncbi:MAG TPA: carbamoyltransferase HypF [Burkholderiaceae bacterium]|nr:carbamoyltransferase HypF [Burkholderiaceae bacterium]
MNRFLNNPNARPKEERLQGRRVVVAGRVQGVGFRPFVYRMAQRYGLSGSVRNDAGRVAIEAYGSSAALSSFLDALVQEAPDLARPQLVTVEAATAVAAQGFRIIGSTDDGGRDGAELPPDQSLCPDCLRELLDPSDRRWRYPFLNCTQCGPRYTVIRDLPYDRCATSMAGFALCPACRREYQDPSDRRFHAEPLACPMCGPQLRLNGGARDTAVLGEAALAACVRALRAGAIVAVKGVGGYHLLCDASAPLVVQKLRERKRRPNKPLAVMFPLAGTDGLERLRCDLDPNGNECAALLDFARPIVLVRRNATSSLPKNLAPGLNEIGALLPYSPLHALLLGDFGGPLVATSGNVSGEPVLTDETQATRELAAVADLFLHHNRPIVRPADDAVVRVVQERARPIRLGRGTAPLQQRLKRRLAEPVLAAGGQMKSTIALAFDDRIVLSPHIGDLDAPRSRDVYALVAQDLQRLYRAPAARVVVDRHPAYASSIWARSTGLPVTEVLHHFAHASALAWERPHVASWLVFAWDGVGLGADGSLWGGEALTGRAGQWVRRGSWRAFRPPGGDRAAREPWRSAAALCWDADLPFERPIAGVQTAHAAWRSGLNAPATSAVGRLFDAAASLVLGLDRVSFEAQGPMQLEALAARGGRGAALQLPMSVDGEGVHRIDWAPLLALLADGARPPQRRAADFHATLARALVHQAIAIRDHVAFEVIGLTGGVFQNRVLCDEIVERCARVRIAVHVPEKIPVNDAGLSFGQIVEFAAQGSDAETGT